MIVLGLDLAGPSRPEASAFARGRTTADGIVLEGLGVGADDATIHDLARAAAGAGDLVVGIDAPLSYNPGGGDRPGDRRLRAEVRRVGLRPGTVMAPTMTRMAYLTLRGLAVARLLEPLGARIVEVHPAACLALRGAPAADVRELKGRAGARRDLLGFLEQRGLLGARAAAERDPTDHEVAACAALLGAHRWAHQRAVWLEAAAPPHHPYDFAC